MDILLQSAGNRRRIKSCAHRQIERSVCNAIFIFPFERTTGYKNHRGRTADNFRRYRISLVLSCLFQILLLSLFRIVFFSINI